MSWSFNAIGKPESFPQFFDGESARLTGDSKAEFDAARPHLAGLIALNSNANATVTLQVNANGHASKKDGAVTYQTCVVEIKPINGNMI